ncbi:MAG: DHA2 family efflux MFS transporter permease subunit [Terracidiphilus sp.]|jgi:DHA2 family multidrug resistance protein
MSTASNPANSVGVPRVEWRPTVNPWMVAVSVMLSTFMVVLDSSIANVALPHIAGSLSASTDESTWVLTSYLVSNAIMLPASSWIARRIGRKRLLMLSILFFTGASMLCGMALNMPMLIVARILQGAGGGGMQPLAQSILLESFPPEKHGKAMAAYGVGIVVAPVIGPTLGGFITDSYSWRWIFYINLPVGLLALFMANLYIEDPPYLRHARRVAIDAIGFALMAVWLGSLQLVLDKGQEADWFEATWICWLTALSVAMFLGFIARELLCRDPIVQLHVLLDPNFRMGTLITGLFGVLLYGVTAFLPLFLQTLLGYSAMQSGLAVSPRGLGSMVAMLVVGVLINRFDSRALLAVGMAIFGVSTLMLSRINLGIAMSDVTWPNFLNGFGGGFVFVPLTTLAMGRLRKQEMGNASGIYNLVRNIGGSIGIAALTANLVRGAQIHQSYMGAHLTANNPVAVNAIQGLASRFQTGGANAVLAHQEALGTLYGSLQQQSALLAYADNFRLLGYLALASIPLAFLFKRPRSVASSNNGVTGE